MARLLFCGFRLGLVDEFGQTGFTSGSGSGMDHTLLGCLIKLRIELIQHGFPFFNAHIGMDLLGEGLDGLFYVVVAGLTLGVGLHSFLGRFVMWHLILFFILVSL